MEKSVNYETDYKEKGLFVRYFAEIRNQVLSSSECKSRWLNI